MQSLVSIIVPVYKVEDCLERCLDSLCCQTMKEIEIVLVDDCSPDRSGEICEKYAEKDSRFKVVHHPENRGLSAARNTGIACSTCNYLMFVDSDDYVHEDFCKLPYECAVRYQADLVMFRLQRTNRLFHNGGLYSYTVNQMHKGYKTQMEAMELLHGVLGHNAVNKLYRKELFKDIFFPEGYLYEDVGTTYKTIWKASKIYYLDRVLYYHCYRLGSITTLKMEKVLNDLYVMSMQQYNDLCDWGYLQDKLNDFLKARALMYCKMHCLMKNTTVSDTRYVFCSNVLCTGKRIPGNFTRQQRVLLLLFKYCRPLFKLTCVLYDKGARYF